MFKRNQIEVNLDNEINNLLELMSKELKYTDNYKSMADQLIKLYELRKGRRISADVLATIGANLAGIVILMNHERAHVIASKAFGFVKKIV
jgi:hypothetical protein